MKKWIFILWLMASNVLAADAMVTKVIELHYQDAQQVIKLIQPLLQPGEQVTGEGQTLIVKVSPDTLTQLRAVLHKLDQPPVTFEIMIHQGDPNWLATQNSNTIVISTPSPTNQRQSQSVMVTNGQSAFVSTGQDQPVVSAVGVGFFTGVSYDRRLVQNGLLIEPLLQGQKVKLTVRRVREQDSNISDQNINEQQVMTTVMVPLNQWVALANAEGDSPNDNDPNTQVISVGNQYSQNSTLYIKVRVVGNQSSGIEKD